MKSRHVAMCNDFLAYAAPLHDRGMRAKFLQTGVAHLKEYKPVRRAQRLHVKPAIMDISASLKFDRWGVYPEFGDPPLSLGQYLDIRVSLIYDEIQAGELQGFPILSLRPVPSAVRDIWSRHGLAAVIPFIKACWKDSLILSLDDFFWGMHTAVRSEAFGLEWQQCQEEMMESQSQASEDSASGGLSILTRSRRMAQIDARLKRDSKALETIARREHKSVEASLAAAKRRPFSSFLREIFALRPIYYTLRDIWYELHFLASEPQDRSEFAYLECLVDEMQADIGQMVLNPLAGPILGDISEWNGRSPSHCRRRMAFWEHSRIQVNHEIAQKIRAAIDLSHDHVDGVALRKELEFLLAKSLSEGQRLAMQMWGNELSNRVKEQSHEPACFPDRAT